MTPLIHAQVQCVTSVSHKESLNSHLKLLFNVPKLYKLNWKIKQNHKSGHTHHNFSPYLSSLQNFTLGKLKFNYCLKDNKLFKIGLFPTIRPKYEFRDSTIQFWFYNPVLNSESHEKSWKSYLENSWNSRDFRLKFFTVMHLLTFFWKFRSRTF